MNEDENRRDHHADFARLAKILSKIKRQEWLFDSDENTDADEDVNPDNYKKRYRHDKRFG
jgi:hypothetical protein